MVRARREAVLDEVLAAFPGWVNELIRLNAVIAERMGVTVSDLGALHALHQFGPATASALAHRVDLTPGSVSRMIDRLDAAGCIKRVPDPDDRRRVLIEPTVEGLDRITTYYEGLTARTREDLDVFDEHDLGLVHRFITRSQDSATTEVARLRSARDHDGHGVSHPHVDGIEVHADWTH